MKSQLLMQWLSITVILRQTFFYDKIDVSMWHRVTKKPIPALSSNELRQNSKNAKIAPIRRFSFHFTEFHFHKFQITNA